ncbi:LysR family transcriptional regulator [Thalassomonas sp. M1454]|uniref:LysR family transcriptional regulator n=1 Tax=Thalassomonas sp. M1454 TaxID=2594477 RepID=UPI00117D9DF2|nr:LysR family transcriptional regulator [Thalassomonas sp. M1454]TRX54484.1 LysR family transcriptional regulator [Thalassomonas sp. M1454]
MNKINQLDLDGNALKTFLTVLEESSVTKAATRLGVTQSAVSHTLDRLRTVLDDPLFIREGRGISPTMKAISLQEPVEAILNRLTLLNVPHSFDPKSDPLKFTIAANDFPTGFIFPTLLKNLACEGIFPSLNFIPAGIPSSNQSRTSDCHMLITPALPNKDGLNHVSLVESKMVCFYDKSMRQPPKTLEQYIDCKYVDVRFSNTESSNQVLPRAITSQLNQATIDVPNFNAVSAFIQGTNLITTQLSVMTYGCLKDLTWAPLPIETKPLNLYLVWHDRDQDDLAHKWFRNKIIETVQAIIKANNH